MTETASQGTQIEICRGVEGIVRRATREWMESLDEASRAGGRMSVALSGGTTPLHLYRHLVSPPTRSRIEWRRVDFFWGDERCVAPTSADSNYGMAQRVLLRHLDLDRDQVHRIRGEQDPIQAVRDYRQRLSRYFGADQPVFDLILLGMGGDGHTASLFPGSACLESSHSVCTAYIEHLEAHRITLTLEAVNRARKVVFMVAGAGKAPALARVLGREGEGLDPLPASLVRPVQGRLIFLVDEAAAGHRPSRKQEGRG